MGSLGYPVSDKFALTGKFIMRTGTELLIKTNMKYIVNELLFVKLLQRRGQE